MPCPSSTSLSIEMLNGPNKKVRRAKIYSSTNDFKDPDAFAIIYYNDLRKNDPSKDDYDEAKNKVISLKIERIKLYQILMQVDFLAS